MVKYKVTVEANGVWRDHGAVCATREEAERVLASAIESIGFDNLDSWDLVEFDEEGAISSSWYEYLGDGNVKLIRVARF